MFQYRISILRLLAVITVGVGASLITPKAQALIFYNTGTSAPGVTNYDASYNTTAPTGFYADSGWQYEGYYGSYLGTMISPNLFITANHIAGNSSTFSYDTIFSGAPTVNYTIDTSANGGLGYWHIAGTDDSNDLQHGLQTATGRVKLNDHHLGIALIGGFDSTLDVLKHGRHDGTMCGQHHSHGGVALRKSRMKSRGSHEKQNEDASGLHDCLQFLKSLYWL